MDTLRTICAVHGIEIEIEPNSDPDPITSQREGSTINRTQMDPLRRSKLSFEGNVIDMEFDDHRSDSWEPTIRIVGDEHLICIIEIMDLGDAPLDPRHYNTITDLHQAIPKGATLIGCDSSYLNENGITYVAHTLSTEDYPMFPIHTGCGLDLIVIREIEGTLDSIANAMVSTAIDIAIVLDEIIGSEPYL